MAHLHFKRTVYKSRGDKAAARVRYITRDEQANESRADRQLRYTTKAGREDLVYTRTRNLPAWAAGNATTYFEAAERQEWALGNAFEEWKITLPHELTQGQNMTLMRDLVEAIAGKRLPITYAFHCPATLSKSREQPHLHLLISARQNDGIARSADQHFKKYNRTNPERGGAPKDPALYHMRAVKQWRVTITDLVNVHLERAGCDVRVHPDRLIDRGIDRRPELKLLPYESQEYREEGKIGPRMQKVLDTRAARQATHAAEQESARTYWTQRKEDLGLTPTMDRAAQLGVIIAARTLRRDQTPSKALVESYAGIEQDDRELGDLAREVVAQAEREADGVWLEVLGRETLAQARQEAQAVWYETWEDQTLLGAGWEAVRLAREEGEAALVEAHAAAQAREETERWQSLEQVLHGLAQRLDGLGEEAEQAGHLRIRLWDREEGRGL